ncbi:MAG: HD-GYP domain-containing protein [Bacillota bacterium]
MYVERFRKDGIKLEQAMAATETEHQSSVANILIVARAAAILHPSDGLLKHSEHVANLVAYVLSAEPGLAGGLSRETVVLAAFLHDLGKARWPPEYFERPAYSLSPTDWHIMQAHPLVGANIARELGVTADVLALIEQHHERRQGKGYPQGLADPHPAALLIGACDAYCACLEPRAYRPEPLPVFEALREAAKVAVPAVVQVLEVVGLE